MNEFEKNPQSKNNDVVDSIKGFLFSFIFFILLFGVCVVISVATSESSTYADYRSSKRLVNSLFFRFSTEKLHIMVKTYNTFRYHLRIEILLHRPDPSVAHEHWRPLTFE